MASLLAAALSRAQSFLLEPKHPPLRLVGGGARDPIEVSVLGTCERCGVSTVAAGLSLMLTSPDQAVIVRDVPWAASDRHETVTSSSGALILVTPGEGHPRTAMLIGSLLREGVGDLLLVANKVRDEKRWGGHADVCLPDTRLGAELVARGLRPPGPFGAALKRLAELVQRGPRSEQGQAMVLLTGVAFVLVFVLAVLGAFGKALLDRGRQQRAADLAAISAARSMRDDFARLFEPPSTPRHLEKSAYLARAASAARAIAGSNGADPQNVQVGFPDERSFAPLRVRVSLTGPSRPDRLDLKATAEAELTPPARGATATRPAQPEIASGGGYSGPLAYRQGKPMRPDVAVAFDRLEAGARKAGIALIVVSGYRSDAEQARLFAQHPDPRWVAPPGKSLHRYATELDLGPASAYAWLHANAPRFGFLKRYAWEPWHFGYVGGNSEQVPDGTDADARDRVPLPAFVPPRYAGAIAAAATRWNVPAELLSAQLFAESNFNPFARSPVGALGIAQFMPGTARSYGLRNPFDAVSSIYSQAHLMHDLLLRFGSTALALAAYNAGPNTVGRCGCVPPYPETQAYVAKILGLMGGAGALSTQPRTLEVRLTS